MSGRRFRFLDDGELFMRPHSAGWAQSNAKFYVLKVGHRHNQDVDWAALSEDLYARVDAGAAWDKASDLDIDIHTWVMFAAGWIAVGSIHLSHHYGSTPDSGSMEALAYFLASAAVWHARRGVDILGYEHELVQVYVGHDPNRRRRVHVPIADLIHRYAAPGVEDALYSAIIP
jgi:hypothetical protein